MLPATTTIIVEREMNGAPDRDDEDDKPWKQGSLDGKETGS